MKRGSLFIVIILFLSACSVSEPGGTDVQEGNISDVQGENTMEENTMEEILLTKDEFIRLIEEYDVGVTIKDFEGVDVEEFIAYYFITKGVFDDFISGNAGLKQTLEDYINNTQRREEDKQKIPYLVRKLEYIDSTDEEYNQFIERYFEMLQMDAQFKGTDVSVIDVYKVAYNDEYQEIDFSFCQTSKSKELPILLVNNKNYMIDVFTGAETTYFADIFYSKSAKYLMYLGGNAKYDFDEYINIVKTFCEMDD